MTAEHLRNDSGTLRHVQFGNLFQGQVNDRVGSAGLHQRLRRALHRLAVLFAADGCTWTQPQHQDPVGGGALRQRQQQGISDLAGEIAAGMQFSDHTAELRIDLFRCNTEVTLFVQTDDRALCGFARLDIDNGRKFHIRPRCIR